MYIVIVILAQVYRLDRKQSVLWHNRFCNSEQICWLLLLRETYIRRCEVQFDGVTLLANIDQIVTDRNPNLPVD
jgi:hypothetical protein